MTNQKSLDKKKAKELDCGNPVCPKCGYALETKDYKYVLTQQRTELLEEIKDLQTYVLFNDTEKLISLEQVINLLNKKND